MLASFWKINLASRVKKRTLELGFINDLDLTKKLIIAIFLDFTPLSSLSLSPVSSIFLSSLTNIGLLVKGFTLVILGIEVSEAAI